MSEAVKAITEYLLNDLGFFRVHIHAFFRNKASSKVAEKAGFEFEAVLKNYGTKKSGEIYDLLSYSKIKQLD